MIVERVRGDDPRADILRDFVEKREPLRSPLGFGARWSAAHSAANGKTEDQGSLADE
jgi:hypothetical protein